MRSGHKRFMKKNIMYLLCLLTASLFLAVFYSWIMLGKYEKQAGQNRDLLLEFYRKSTDEELERLNGQILIFLLEDTDVNERIPRIWADTDGFQEMMRVNARNDVNRRLLEMSRYYGERYNFWYYDRDRGIYCESGNGTYESKRRFRQTVTKLCDGDAMPLTKRQQWFLLDAGGELFAVSAYQEDGRYAGCEIPADELARSLYDMEGSGVWEICVRASEIPPDSEYSEIRLEYAEFDFYLAGPNGMQRQADSYRIITFVIAMLITVLLFWLIWFARAGVIKPLQVFSENIRRFRETGSFDMRGIYGEFEETGQLLEELWEEIGQLKVSIYEERLEKQKAELDYLSLQIRPHFYINCMSNICSLARMKCYYEIEDLTIYVSDYLRSVFRTGMVPVPLEEELESIRNYLEIHKILYRDGLEYEILEEETKDCRIPPLVLQVFVENCIRHTADAVGELRIRVHAWTESGRPGMLRIRIGDNGPGFPDDMTERDWRKDQSASDSRFHVGLRNVFTRLQLMYGDAAGIILSNKEEGGACAEVFLPAADMEER